MANASKHLGPEHRDEGAHNSCCIFFFGILTFGEHAGRRTGPVLKKARRTVQQVSLWNLPVISTKTDKHTRAHAHTHTQY